MHKMGQFILIFSLSIFLTACSGGGGSSTSSGGGSATPTSPNTTTSNTTAIGGTVSKGPVINATIDVYTFNTNGTQGSFVVGDITTDAYGAWNANIPSTATGPFMVIATGGSFIDEYTGTTVPLGVIPLRGILPIGATSAPITPISDAAVTSIQQMVTDGYASSPADAFSTVQTNYVNSFRFDPLTVLPPAPENLATASAEELMYAAVLGGISTLANDAYSQLSTGGNTPDRMEIIAQMADDFAADGSIDGYGAAGASLNVNVGGVAQTLNGVFTGGANLGSAVTTYQALPTAPAQVSGATVTVTPVDFTQTLYVNTPSITITAPANNSTYTKDTNGFVTIPLTVNITDFDLANGAWHVILDGVSQGTYNFSTSGAFSQNLSVGTHTIKVELTGPGKAYTPLASQNTQTITINVQNTASPVPTTPVKYVIKGTITGSSSWELKTNNNAFVNDGVSQSGNVTFGSIDDGATYTVTSTTVGCSVTNGTGTVNGADVTNVTITCGSNTGIITLNASTFCPVNPPATTTPTFNGWQWAQPSNSGTNLNTVVEGNGVFIAAGDFGQMLRSTDKVTWTAVDSGATTTIQNIIWDGSAFIIPGNPIRISCDGIHWVQKPLNATLNNTINGSTTNLSLSKINIADKYYTFSGNAMYESTDAVNWIGNQVTAVTAAGKFASFSLVANNGTTFVAKTSNPESTLVSNDAGVTWQTITAAPVGYRLLFWNGTHFVADLNFDIATSLDGINWVTTPIAGGIAFSTVWTPHMITYQGTHVRYGGNDFLQYSSYNNNGGIYIPNASNVWEAVRWADTNNQNLYKINHAIVTSTNSLLVVGDGGMIAETSTNPLPLIPVLNPPSFTNPWTRLSNDITPLPLRKIASNGTSFVAVGDYGHILYSTDGYAWAKASLPTYKPTAWLTIPIDKNFNEILWTGTEYLAIGDNTTLLTSPNGQTWTLNGVVQASGVSSVPSILDPANGTIVRSDNYIHTKDAAGVYRLGNNASKWSKVDISGGSNLKAVAFANNGTRYVAIGSYGMSSTLTPSGVWTPVNLTNIPSINTYTFVGIAHNGSKFIATAHNTVNNTQVVIQSVDGLTWAQITGLVGAPNIGKTIRGGNGKFVSLGNTPKESIDGGITWTNVLPHPLLSIGWNNYDSWYDYLNTPTHDFLIGYRNTVLVK